MSHPPSFTPNLRGSGRRAVPSVLQMEAAECGAACLGMILAHHGLWVPLEALRVRCGVSRDGVNAANMLSAARRYGMVADGFRVRRPADLFDFPFPMILFWKGNHFVVLEGIKRSRVYINDPAEGPRRLTLGEFTEDYSGLCFAFRPGEEFRPGGNPPNLMRGLRQRLGQAVEPLVFASLATLALVVPGLALPAMLAAFIDEVLIGENGSWLGPLLIGLGAVGIIQGILTWTQRSLLARMETKLAVAATTRFVWHLVTLPMPFFDQRYAGDITNRIKSNDTLARLVSGELAVNVINALTVLVYAGAMLAYDVPLTMIGVALAVGSLAVLRFSSGPRETASHRFSRERGKLSGASANGIQTIETLKGSGSEGDFFARWSGIQANALDAQQRLGVVEITAQTTTAVLSQLSAVAVLALGGLRVAEGALTVGGVVAFQSLLRSFSGPLSGLVRFGADLQRVKADMARLDDVLNYKSDPRAAEGLGAVAPDTNAPTPRGAVEVEGITFGYNVGDPPLITDFSLSIAPGQRVALVGESGSGKSTIARIVCGLLEPWSGSVRIDGRRIGDISPARFAEIVAHVDQEITLFQATARENVTLWDPTVPDRAVVSALRDAAIHELFASKPQEIESPVDEDGRDLSGGQRQRLELARALVRDPAVLILDEATSALDPLTELEIDDRLRRRGCTCLIVAHRLSTVRDADEILVLERGRIVQRGVHDRLMEEDGPYRTLVRSH